MIVARSRGVAGNEELVFNGERVSVWEDEKVLGSSLAAQWLRLCMVIAKGKGLIPGQGTKISHARSVPKKREKVLKMDSSDGYKAMCMFLPLNYTL